MQIDAQLTDAAVLTELGSRIARRRLSRNLSQDQLADQAGVSRSAVQALERGDSVSATSLIRILRALGLAESLNRLVPEPGPSPMELLELQGRQRQRASGVQHREVPTPWTWGDE